MVRGWQAIAILVDFRLLVSGMIPDIAAAGISAATELETKAAMVGYQRLCENRCGPQVPGFHFFMMNITFFQYSGSKFSICLGNSGKLSL
ncbi:MAG: hypothetical protein B6D72_07720 [gamma proteobacterium symbiont of Ctena orbiculata]|nr:MAG: hypothetical protein B6D72_07720 [gamma proteobacterium symbiont of Ctena orbiculata]PVV15869.1 MAG: hypothetical protein B6D82_02460 [gamma proteobacterium symbiont of Ctena orbiculata]PVV17419.1 MAG: hypothetical protein B6D74_18215 [gamma proteobacterium symbiont of Ctena orbiculata]